MAVRRSKINLWLQASQEVYELVRICRDWMDVCLENGMSLQSRNDVLSSDKSFDLSARLLSAGFQPFGHALVWLIADHQGTEPAEAALVSYALAVAAGEIYAALGPKRLPDIGHLVSALDLHCWEDFANSAANTLAEDVELLRAFTDQTAEMVCEARLYPDRVIDTWDQRVSMPALIEEYRRLGSFQKVWQSHHIPAFFCRSDTLEILRRADPRRFLYLVEQLPHPSMIEACLANPTFNTDHGQILKILSNSSAAFTDEGKWRSEGATTVLLLKLLHNQFLKQVVASAASNTHATPLFSSVADPDSNKSSEDENEATFEEKIAAALNVIFARPDAHDLGWHWLEAILQRAPKANVAGREIKNLIEVEQAITLARAVSSRLRPRASQRYWLNAVPVVFRQHRATSVLCVATFGIDRVSIDVRHVVKELFNTCDFGFTTPSELLNSPIVPLRLIAGEALATIPEVDAWFSEMWSWLRCKREQAWSSLRTGPTRDTQPAEVMIVWGFGILEALLADGAKHFQASAMWRSLEKTIREGRLVEFRLHNDCWTAAIARLFVYWTKTVGKDKEHGNRNERDSRSLALAQVIDPYIEISTDFMAVVVALYEAGVSAIDLRLAVGHCGDNLDQILARFIGSTRGLDETNLWNQKWTFVLRQLKTVLETVRGA